MHGYPVSRSYGSRLAPRCNAVKFTRFRGRFIVLDQNDTGALMGNPSSGMMKTGSLELPTVNIEGRLCRRAYDERLADLPGVVCLHRWRKATVLPGSCASSSLTAAGHGGAEPTAAGSGRGRHGQLPTRNSTTAAAALAHCPSPSVRPPRSAPCPPIPGVTDSDVGRVGEWAGGCRRERLGHRHCAPFQGRPSAAYSGPSQRS